MLAQVMRTNRFRVTLVALMWLSAVLQFIRPVPPGQDLALSWAFLPLMFLWLGLLWDGRGRPSRAAVISLVAMVLSMWLCGVAFGLGVRATTHITVGHALGGLAVVVIYARLRGSARAPIDGGAALMTVILAAGVGVLITGVIGGFPGYSSFGSITELMTWMWMSRSFAFTLAGIGTVQVLFYDGNQDRYPVPRPPVVAVLLLLVVGAAAYYFCVTHPAQPVTWLLLVPALWAGMMLSVWGTAAYGLALAGFGNLLAFLRPHNFEFGVVTPTLVVGDQLVATAILVSLQVAFLRDAHQQAIESERSIRRLREEQATLVGHVFDSMSDGLVLLDATGEILRSNPASQRIMRRPLPVGTPMNAETLAGLRHLDGSPFREGVDPLPHGIYVLEGPDGPDGPQRTVLDERSVMLSDNRLMTVFSDVTAAHDHVNELQLFARNVAHDLRSPLTALNGWVDLALESTTNPLLLPLLKRASSAGQRMSQVIDDWLSHAVVHDGALNLQTVELASVLNDVAAPQAEDDRSPVFVIDTPHRVCVDEGLIRQVLANLISNAVKFTPPDRTPRIEVVSEVSDEESDWVRLSIRDNGIGLDAGEERKIFEEFHRSPGAAQGFEGTGLGLATCQRIVVRHGGQIAAHRNDDQQPGSTFTLTLPIECRPVTER